MTFRPKFQFDKEKFPTHLPENSKELRVAIVERIVDVIVGHTTQIDDFRRDLDPIARDEFDKPFHDVSYFEIFSKPRKCKTLRTQYQALRRVLRLQKQCMKKGYTRVCELPDLCEYENTLELLYEERYPDDWSCGVQYIPESDVLRAFNLKPTPANYAYIERMSKLGGQQ